MHLFAHSIARMPGSTTRIIASTPRTVARPRCSTPASISMIRASPCCRIRSETSARMKTLSGHAQPVAALLDGTEHQQRHVLIHECASLCNIRDIRIQFEHLAIALHFRAGPLFDQRDLLRDGNDVPLHGLPEYPGLTRDSHPDPHRRRAPVSPRGPARVPAPQPAWICPRRPYLRSPVSMGGPRNDTFPALLSRGLQSTRTPVRHPRGPSSRCRTTA